MNYFVEGLQGSGNSTLVQKLSEMNPGYTAVREGEWTGFIVRKGCSERRKACSQSQEYSVKIHVSGSETCKCTRFEGTIV